MKRWLIGSGFLVVVAILGITLSIFPQRGGPTAIARWAQAEHRGEPVSIRSFGLRSSAISLVAAGLEEKAIGELELHALKLVNRFTKLLPLACIGNRSFQRTVRNTDHLCANSDAAFIQRFTKSAWWHRTIWQVCLLSLLALPLFELSGAARGAVGWLGRKIRFGNGRAAIAIATSAAISTYSTIA